MRGERNEHKYSLIHATNHLKGRELMKSAMWKLTPHGSFIIRQSDDPRQQLLIELKPNLKPLEESLLSFFNEHGPSATRPGYVLADNAAKTA